MNRKQSCCRFLFAFVVGALLATGAYADHGPYFQMSVYTNGASQAWASWYTTSAYQGSVDYGLTTSYGSTATEASSVNEHRVLMTGMIPGTNYYYRTKNGATVVNTGSMASGKAPGQPIRILISSDHRDCFGGDVGGFMGAANADLWVDAGDVGNSCSQGDIECGLFGQFGAALARVSYFWTPGNHEGCNCGIAQTIWNKQPGDLGAANQNYHVRYGDIDIFTGGDCLPSQSTLLAAVANSSAPWKIFAYHEPAYSGGGGSGHGENTGYKATCDAFGDAGGDLIINGHSHFFWRSVPIHGVISVTEGAGGASLYTFSTIQTYGAAGMMNQDSYGIADISGTQLYMRYYDTGNNLLDESVIDHSYHHSLDGLLDTNATLLASRSGGQSIWYNLQGNRWLYLATQDPASSGNDVMLFISTNPGSGTSSVAYQTKAGTVAAFDAVAVAENDQTTGSTYKMINKWFKPDGTAIPITNANAVCRFGRGNYFETIIDLQKLYGGVPGTLYVTAARYANGSGGALVAASQCPAGNGDGNIDAAEMAVMSFTPPPLPNTPTNVVATAASATEIDVTWAVASNATSYIVKRGGSPIGTAVSTSFPDTGLSPSTLYCYTVIASNSTGASAESSPSACATTQPPPPLPDTPANLVATASDSTQVNVSWSSSANASAYVLRRDGTVVTTTAATAYSDTGRAPSTQYCYTITATNITGASVESFATCATTLSGPCIVLDGEGDSQGYVIASRGGNTNLYAMVKGNILYVAAPAAGDAGGANDSFVFVTDATSALTAAPWAKAGQVAVSWSTKPWMADESASNYKTWNNGGASALIAADFEAAGVVEGTLDLVQVFGSVPSTLYIAFAPYATADGGALAAGLQIPAGNGDGNLDANEFVAVSVAAIHDEDCDRVFDSLGPPATPANVLATAVSSAEIDVSWTAVTGASQYVVKRGGTPIATTASTSYPNTGLSPNTQYCYTVIATNSSGASAESSPSACATTQALPQAPATPTNLVATAVSTNQINVSWASVSNATSYVLRRDGSVVTNTTATSYADTGRAPSTQYCYTIAATNAAGSSAESPSVCATALSTPLFVIQSVIPVGGGGGLTITWSSVPGTSYVVESTDSLTLPFSSLSATQTAAQAQFSMSYTDTTAANVLNRFYRIKKVPPAGAQGSDNAADAAYSGGWASGSNGGTGFGPWTLTGTGVLGSNTNGYFIGSSTNNAGKAAPGIDVSGKSWGIWANSGNFTAAYRAFNSSLVVGQSLLISMDNGYIDTGASDGFVLRNGNATSSPSDYNVGARFEFFFIGGGADYQVVDLTGVHDIGTGWTGTGKRLVFTLTGTDTYTLLTIDNASGATNTFSGTLTGSGTVNSIALFNRNAGSTSDRDAFFNSLQIIGP